MNVRAFVLLLVLLVIAGTQPVWATQYNVDIDTSAVQGPRARSLSTSSAVPHLPTQ
jgi:hypothetical protein